MNGRSLAGRLRITARFLQVLGVAVIVVANSAVLLVGPQTGLTLLVPSGVLHVSLVVAHAVRRAGLRTMTVVGMFEVALGIGLVLSLPNLMGPCCSAPEPWGGTTPALVLMIVGAIQLAASAFETGALRIGSRTSV